MVELVPFDVKFQVLKVSSFQAALLNSKAGHSPHSGLTRAHAPAFFPLLQLSEHSSSPPRYAKMTYSGAGCKTCLCKIFNHHPCIAVFRVLPQVTDCTKLDWVSLMSSRKKLSRTWWTSSCIMIMCWSESHIDKWFITHAHHGRLESLGIQQQCLVKWGDTLSWNLLELVDTQECAMHGMWLPWLSKVRCKRRGLSPGFQVSNSVWEVTISARLDV